MLALSRKRRLLKRWEIPRCKCRRLCGESEVAFHLKRMESRREQIRYTDQHFRRNKCTKAVKSRAKKNNRLKPKKDTGNDPTGAQRIKVNRYLEEKSKQEETSAVKARGLDLNLFLFPTRGDVIWKDLLKGGFERRLVVYPSEPVQATSVHRHIGQGWWCRRWVRCPEWSTKVFFAPNSCRNSVVWCFSTVRLDYFLFALHLHSQYKLLGSPIASQLTWSNTQVVYVTSVQFTNAAVARLSSGKKEWKKG